MPESCQNQFPSPARVAALMMPVLGPIVKEGAACSGTPTLIGFWAQPSGIASTRVSSIPSTRSILESLLGYERLPRREPATLIHREAASVLQHLPLTAYRTAFKRTP